MRFLPSFGLGRKNKIRHRSHHRRLAKRRVLVEALEDRRLLAAYVVDTLSDEVVVDGMISLREAIQSANDNAAANADVVAGDLDGDTITFAGALSGGTINLAVALGELSITDDLTIDGSAGVASSRITIDAGGNSRIFNVDTSVVTGTNSAVALSELIVTNGDAGGGNGGGISEVDSPLTLTNVDITSNNALVGGGISGEGGSVTVTGGTISGNTATSGGGITVLGDASLVISNSTIENNSAASDGGGIFVNEGSVATVDGGTISNNTASGALAGDGGGGIINFGGTLTIGNTSPVTISDNVADGAQGSGGGIFNGNGGTLTVSSSFITGNIANRAGGGIEENNGGGVTLTDVTLNTNVAGPAGTANPGNGGGLHVTGDGIVDIVDGTVNDNTAEQEGGGLWNSGTGTLTIDGTTISGNIANSANAASDAQGGGGIFNDGGTLEISNGVIESNIALDPDAGVTQDDGGGGIFNNGGTVTIIDSDIAANDATDGLGNGGGILTLGGDVTVDGGAVDGNQAARAGGGIENNAGLLTLIDVIVEFNTAAINGGGVHVSGAGTTGVTDSIIDSNTAAEEGGGLWNSSGGTMMIDGVTISTNTASGDGADQGGGGIFNDGGTVRLMNNVVVDFNFADGLSGSGGGLFNNAGGTLTIEASSVTGNTANRAGGGIEDNSGAGFGTTLTDVILENNEASGLGSGPGNGGGLHVTGAADVSITGGTVALNRAAAEGGGLWNGSGTLTINATTISSNTASGDAADQGGGGVFNNGGTVNIGDFSDISTNMADGLAGSGGGILNDGGTLTITQSFIDDNSAVRAGGGIEVTTANSRDSIAILTNVSLSGNSVGSSPGNGGGVHVSDLVGNNTSTFHINGGSVEFNSAANEGGGLWNDAGGTMTIDGTTIDGNTASGAASGGGGVFNNGGTVTTQRVSVTNNSADALDGDGGGIFNDAGGTLSVTDSTISGNAASNNGGGINNNAALAVTNSTISGNAAFNGGGIFTNSPAISAVINSSISGNSADANGGGIFNSNGTLTAIHSTIVANRSDADDDASGTGGGIWTFDDASTFTNLFNTVVAGNVTAADASNDIAEKAIELGSANNLIGDPSSAGGLDEGAAGNRIGDGSGALLPLDQILDPTLADNGGPTFTHALVTNSRALDGGDNTFSTTTGDDGLPGTGDTNETPILGDQRGFPFQREFAANVDIGAFEQQTVDTNLLIVTTTDDSVAFDSEVSLREAIIAAEAIPGDNTILFDSTVFATAQTIQLGLGQLSSLDDNALTIDGPGRDLVTIDGQSNSRVLFFGGSGDLTVDGITITGGQTTQSGEDGDGAGIRFIGGTLTVTDSEISGNTILGAGGFGGGLYSSGDMTVTGSTVSGNHANYFGGGLFVDGEAMISDSTVTGNSAGYSGAGIHANDATISSSTISDNTATVSGGGIKASAVSITGTTISGNSAGNDGGGILATNATILNSTLSGNTATQHGGGVRILLGGDAGIVNSTITANDALDGGGVYGYTDIINLTIDNSIVAANTSAGATPDVFAPATIRNSLIGNLEGTIPALTEAQPSVGPDANGNFVGDLNGGGLVDPMLGPLADNGGPTETHALLTGSPAIDAGSNALVPTGVDVDQRGTGFPRVIDGDLSGTATVDMGAFEVQVQSVNQQPTFTASNPPTVLEDSRSNSVNGFATFDPGDPNESTQTVLAYTVSGITNAALFSTLPAIDIAGNLTYTLADNAFGASDFSVVVQDDGGTAGGGVDTSDPQVFTITVTGINDAPSFTASNPPAVLEDSGAQTVTGFATFDPGNAYESTQSVMAYTVSNVTNSALFSTPPAIDSNGVLTYTPAAGAFGTSDFTVSVQDDGGTTDGGVDISAAQTFTITVTEVASNAGVLDVTGNGNANPFQDGIIIVRFMLGQPDENLEDPLLIPNDATRTTGAELRAFLEAAGDALDANGDGNINPFQDGILIVRFLLGQPDANLEDPALIPAGSTRTTGAEIRAYLETLLPPPSDGEFVPQASAGGEGESVSQTPISSADVNGDGSVTARDALNVLNAIQRGESNDDQGWSLDSNRDGNVTASDALYVINRLADDSLISQIASAVSDSTREHEESDAVDRLLSDQAFVEGLF